MVVLHMVMPQRKVSVVKQLQKVSLDADLIPDSADRGRVPDCIRFRQFDKIEEVTRCVIPNVEEFVLLLVPVKGVIELQAAADAELMKDVKVRPEIFRRGSCEPGPGIDKKIVRQAGKIGG